MMCVICKIGETHPGRTTVHLHRDSTDVLIRNVPADICENCGEYYLSSEMTDRVLRIGEDAVRKGAEVEILKFVA